MSKKPTYKKPVNKLPKEDVKRKRMGAKVQEAETKYRVVFETARDAIFLSDDTGRFVDVNEAACESLGYKKEELLKLSNRELDADSRGYEAFLKVRDELEEKVTFEVNQRKKDGTLLPVEITGSFFKIKGKRMAVAIARDITERKQAMEALLESEDKYRTIFKNAQVGLFQSRVSDGKLLHCNDRFAHIVGYRDRKACCAEYIASKYYVDAGTRELMITTINKTGEIQNFEARLRRIDNSIIWVRYSGYLNQKKGCIEGVLTDITEEKMALQTLQRSHDKLEQVVKERTADLSKTNEQLTWEIEERKEAEHALQYQFQLQGLLTTLSTEFINLASDEIDDGIKRALRKLGEFIGVDRTYVFLFYDNLTKMDITHEWCADGIEPQIHNGKGFFVKDFPWCEERIKRFETIHIPCVADLPPEDIEKEIFQSQQIQSLILVPMASRKSLYGFMRLDSVRTEKAWPDHIIILLKIVGDIFANALERRQTEEILRKSESKLRFLSSQLIVTHEDERKRISWEIHDNVGQSIAAMKLSVEQLLRQSGRSTENFNAQSLDKVVLIARQAIREARKIQMNLRPSLLDDMGIVATISWFCRKFERIYEDISIEKQIRVQEEDIPPVLRVVIFRVVQEAFKNVAKHAEADRVRVSLQATNSGIELAIQDNGAGFDVEQAWPAKNSQQGFGLISMKERVEFSGGFFSIESKKGSSGTLVQASWLQKHSCTKFFHRATLY
jgi:PAS domain S-box-containing protein